MSTLMSSDQQLNIHISVDNDLCPNNDNQRDCDNSFECSVNYTKIENTLDDIITANIVIDNEKFADSGSKEKIKDTEYSSGGNFQSISPDEAQNVFERVVNFDEKSEFKEIVVCHNGEQEIVDVSKTYNFAQNNCDGTFIQPTRTVTVDSQIDALPQTIDQSNEQYNEQSNKQYSEQHNEHRSTQSQNCSDAENNDVEIDEGTKCNENEIANEAKAVNDEQTDTEISKVIEESEKNGETCKDRTETFRKDQRSITPEAITSHVSESTTLNKVHVNDCDDEEIGKSDEMSNDENDDLDSNEDSGEFPDIIDFDGTNEVENDEYILDTFVRKPRKERRRIVSMNDDSDREIEVERERLLQSPLIEENELSDIEDVKEEIEQMIRNEKPGPKSKKMSTQKLKEFQARSLLRNAIVIPSSGSKKKKCRIIDSDDDDGDNSLLPYCVDVDDIGLPDVNEDNEDNEADGLVTGSILLNEIDAFPIDHRVDHSNQNASAEEQSICGISQDENVLQEKSSTEKCQIVSIPIQSQKQDNFPSESLQELQQQEESDKYEPSDLVSVNETANMHDSGNSTDSTNQQSNKEHDIEVANIDFPPFLSSSSSEAEDEFIPNDVYFGTPDNSRKSTRGKGRPRGRPAQSSPRGITACQNVARGRATGRRGRPPRREQFIDNRQTSSTSGSMSTSSSESEDEYQKSKARRKPHTVTIVKSPSQLYHSNGLSTQPIQKQQIIHKSQIIEKQQTILKQQAIQKQQPIQRQNHRKRDRFYDKSQDIPNSIYFGDVGDVPLHVLYSYGDSDSDMDVKNNSNVKSGESKLHDYTKGNPIRFSSQVSRGRGKTISHPNSYGQMHNDIKQKQIMPPYLHSHKTRGRPKMNAVSPSNDRSIQMMKTFLKAAGLKKVKLNRLWEGCKSNSERAAKMLELLREKGLEGEPTISKCKQLKVDYLTKKEIEDLDPNLIIQTEGRTRRSVTRAATKRKYTYDEDEILETRTKLRKVIDSDSDFD